MIFFNDFGQFWTISRGVVVEGGGLGVNVLDGLGKVLDGLEKARAFQKHITLRGQRH